MSHDWQTVPQCPPCHTAILSYRIGIEDAGLTLKPRYPPLYNILRVFDTISNQFWLTLLFPVPVISNLNLRYTSWLLQKHSSYFQNELTTSDGKLFQTFMIFWVKTYFTHIIFRKAVKSFPSVSPCDNLTNSEKTSTTQLTVKYLSPLSMFYLRHTSGVSSNHAVGEAAAPGPELRLTNFFVYCMFIRRAKKAPKYAFWDRKFKKNDRQCAHPRPLFNGEGSSIPYLSPNTLCASIFSPRLIEVIRPWKCTHQAGKHYCGMRSKLPTLQQQLNKCKAITVTQQSR